MAENVPGGFAIPRRTVLAMMPAVLAMGLGPKAMGAQADAARSQRESAFAALLPYCGVYQLTNDHSVGINRFLNDAGEGVLLFADYRTNIVRSLFEGIGGAYTMGPTFDARSPVELTVRFEGSGGRVERLVLRKGDGIEAAARKTLSRDEEVFFQQGNARLAGTLSVPEEPGPHPAIALLHGSGPLTRHSFGPYPRFFNSLGLAVLVYDKRGTGASTGRRLDASTGTPETLWPAHYPDDLLADALAALRFLQGRAEIDGKRIGFWGSSEGGMLTTQVAARSKDVAFAINSSGFMGPLWKTILYQGAAMMRAAGKPESEIEEALAFNRFWMQVAQTGRGYDEFLARREAIVRSGKAGWLFYMNGAFSSLAQMRWAWRHILRFDPLPALRRVRCPVLGLFGQADVLTDATEASRAMRQALAAGGDRDVSVQVVPNASHSLMETPSRRGMAPGVFDTLRDWLLARME
jgi:pimeloyl-ACP methyl ester carboxylesterase